MQETPIKHVKCGGIVVQYRKWGRPVYECPRCGLRSRRIEVFTISFSAMGFRLGRDDRGDGKKRR